MVETGGVGHRRAHDHVRGRRDRDREPRRARAGARAGAADPGEHAFRALFFLPVLISSLSAGYVARGLLDPAGTVNQGISAVTTALGLGQFYYGWLGDRTLVLFIIAAVHAWKWGGIVMLVYITGLTAVPCELLDSGRVDGARRASWCGT